MVMMAMMMMMMMMTMVSRGSVRGSGAGVGFVLGTEEVIEDVNNGRDVTLGLTMFILESRIQRA